jgi:monovalent cation:H+ antiporter, CPA1 family
MMVVAIISLIDRASSKAPRRMRRDGRLCSLGRGLSMEQFLATETLIIELLLIVSLVAIAVRRLRVPYTVALVIVGLLLTLQQPVAIDLTPELILALFVPPLIFEAAFQIEFQRLRENLIPILVLAIPGVLLTTVIVGVIVAVGANLSLTTALVFGALISATDPVAVVALFRALGTPKSLTVLIEGESLFNDGTAIIVFNLMLAAAGVAAVTGGSAPASFDLGRAVVDFIVVVVGGLGVGGLLGWLVARLIAQLDDCLIETTLTTVLAFGAYLIAERLHFSGVLAVVAAGLVNGNLGPRGMSPTTRIVLFNFWEYLAFIANSLVFLLIGLDVNIPQITANIIPIGVAVLAVVMTRALIVYGLTWLINRRTPTVSQPYQHVLFWGGLRGAICLALALSLPSTFADRELVRVMAFGVVLFTLLGQGTTMQFLLKRLGLTRRAEEKLEFERRHGRLMATRAARERIEQWYREGTISELTWKQLSPELDQQVQTQLEAQHELLHQHPALQAEELADAKREGLRAQRATLATLLRDGVISERTYEELLTEIDTALEQPSNSDEDGSFPENESNE